MNDAPSGPWRRVRCFLADEKITLGLSLNRPQRKEIIVDLSEF